MKKAIVTGANGFVGSHVVKELRQNQVEVIALVRNEDSNIDSLIGIDNLTVIYCELNTISTLTKLIDTADVFYHFAWEGSAGEARMNPSLQLQNAIWTADCIKVASELGCERFVCAGSIMEKEMLAAVYTQGNNIGLPYIYGTGKVAAHAISKAVASDLGINMIWGNITNAYGAGELSPRFINTTIRKIINREALQFTAATQNYDFIYVTDVAKAFYLLGLNGQANYEYTIGSGKAKPLKEFIYKMKESLAPNQNFIFGDIPFTGIELSLEQFSTDLLKEHTGFKPTISFEDGVKLTRDWLYEENNND
ncbi:NAD-dependent epimerase/dehydratase family protein [Sporosarcina sp. FSL K6-3457]|uniref:NAD-dependent epimerase/dehydratase family protein n=1 Tax=Sporosarcina sp. FSL K6-3457 TaxID=2978204 RepID=UPI0030F869A7